MSSEEALVQWNRLREGGATDNALEVPSIATGVGTGFGPMRYALGSKGEARLLVPCGTGARPEAGSGSARLNVKQSNLRLDDRRIKFIDVTCMDSALENVFAELANEIKTRLVQGSAPAEAVDGAIGDFRSLLERGSIQGIDSSVLTGLVGELLVLKDLVRISPKAVATWRGPFDQRHDFRARSDAIEVKTSARSDASKIRISGIDQLDTPTGGHLALVHIRVERSANGEIFISRLIEEIHDLCGDSAEFSFALKALGCLDPSAPEWNATRFGLEGIDWYRVEEGFPRVVSGTFAGGRMPPSVSELKYTIDLSGASRFRMSQAEALDYARTFLQ